MSANHPVAATPAVLSLAKNALLQKKYQDAQNLLQNFSHQPEAAHLLALAYFYNGDKKKGINHLENLLVQYPDWGDLYYNLGTLLQECEESSGIKNPSQRAVEVFAAVYLLQQTSPEKVSTPADNILINYISAASRTKNWALATSLSLRLLAEHPDQAEIAYNNLSFIYFQTNQADLAYLSAKKALALDIVKESCSWLHLGNACVALKQTTNSIAAFKQGLAMTADNLPLRFNLGLAYLLDKNWQEGWTYYETRWHVLQPSPVRRDLTQTEWRGHPHDKNSVQKTLLIYCEQGFGDTIQFLRFIPALRAVWQGDIWLEVQEELFTLVTQTWHNRAMVGTVFARGRHLIKGHDYQCPLLSLPLALQEIQQQLIYLSTPYFHIPYSLALPQYAPSIGVVWAGSATHSRDVARSMRCEEFLQRIIQPLRTALPSLQFFNLQVKPRADDEPWIQAAQFAEHPLSLDNFLASARLVNSLDIVICVDTSIAHLAAAMGKPVFMLLPYAPDWRWGESGNQDHTWYATLRLFRCEEPNNWSVAITQLLKAVVDYFASVPPSVQNTAQLPHFLAGYLYQKHPATTTTIAQAEDLPTEVSGLYQEAHKQLVQKNYQAALDILQQHLDSALTTQQAQSWLHAMGNCYLNLKNHANAEKMYRAALRLNPQFLLALRELVISLQAQNKYIDALSFLQTIAQISDTVEDWGQLIIACFFARQYSVAIAYCDMLLARDTTLYPRHELSQILQNKGACLLHQNITHEAEHVLKQALKARPTYPIAEFNLAIALLLQQKYTEGWQYYEARLSIPGRDNFHFSHLPRWHGEALGTGRYLIIEAEQGLGDVVMLARFIVPLLQRGLCLALFVQPACRQWLRELEGVAPYLSDQRYVVIENSHDIPNVVAHIPIFSLPYVLDVTTDNIPSTAGYWHTNAATSKTNIITNDKNILLVWRGNAKNANDATRSISMEIWHEEWQAIIQLLQQQGYQVFTLLFDHNAAEQTICSSLGIIDLHHQVKDLADSAALMTKMQLVISVDTLPAHLAGAAGIPTWILLPHFPDFRWLQERSDSVWYQSATLFRQPSQADWGSVFSLLKNALQNFLRDKA